MAISIARCMESGEVSNFADVILEFCRTVNRENFSLRGPALHGALVDLDHTPNSGVGQAQFDRDAEAWATVQLPTAISTINNQPARSSCPTV
jgi:hypothetical protein